MALALLDFTGWEQQHAVFKIDIGTNGFYKFRIGNGKEEKTGLEVIENVTTSTRLSRKKNGDASFFDTSENVKLPRKLFDRTNRYIQLVSSKTESGKSPAVSSVITVPVEAQNISADVLDLNSSISVMPELQFNRNRWVPHSKPFLAQELSFEDLLSSLIRTVLPAAINFLGGNGAITSGNTGAATPTSTANAIGGLLNLLLRAVSGAPAVSSQQSYSNGDYGLNRFADPQHSQFSKPFIFGIDDALLAGLAGPLLQQGIQLLPQLINAANQHKLETLRANNQLMSTLNADVQRRLLQQLLQNMPSAAAGGSAMDPTQLMQLLQQLQAMPPAASAPPAATTAAPAPAAPATASSLSFTKTYVSYALSNSVILSFENKNLQKWNGADRIIYQKGKGLQFDVKLTVNPAPKAPLPKAIFRFVLKDAATQQVVFEKSFKQKNIAANALLNFKIAAEELFQIPIQKPLSLFAEMRWLSAATGKEYKAVGSDEVVFVQDYFVKETGKTLVEEKELTDLNTYRSFWNKVWEAPVLTKGGDKKLWELNATLRYSIFLSPEHEANGLIETKIQQTPDESDSITAKTYGKFKSGIELSTAELNKLLSLWSGEAPLDTPKLQAVSNMGFSKSCAGEMIYTLKLKGREGVRGLVWAIPTFKLLELTLNKVSKTNDAGQVTECVEEKAKFPVPVSVRILGLKSKS